MEVCPMIVGDGIPDDQDEDDDNDGLTDVEETTLGLIHVKLIVMEMDFQMLKKMIKVQTP